MKLLHLAALTSTLNLAQGIKLTSESATAPAQALYKVDGSLKLKIKPVQSGTTSAKPAASKSAMADSKFISAA